MEMVTTAMVIIVLLKLCSKKVNVNMNVKERKL
jgi:hypothetical protein